MFPACAGMTPTTTRTAVRLVNVPRRYGDGAVHSDQNVRRQGTFLASVGMMRVVNMTDDGVAAMPPAHAGMVRGRTGQRWSARECSPYVRGWRGC